MDINSYKFSVSDPGNINIQRICDEADPSRMALFVIGPKNALVILRKEFLNRFYCQDKIGVNGVYLHREWGSKFAMMSSEETWFKVSSGLGQKLHGWRADNTVDLGVIPHVFEQIKQASKFRRRIKITVKGITS